MNLELQAITEKEKDKNKNKINLKKYHNYIANQ